VVVGLKEKLTEAMETLKKNSETIEFLNKSLTEAQKFSFRALLSSKQNVASGSVAAAVTPLATIPRPDSAAKRINMTSSQQISVSC